ncbi:hypothetical protein L7F22_063281 [Adiantum nelumboides]|nr:hypothetical protein [Adiantum nelumboides]
MVRSLAAMKELVDVFVQTLEIDDQVQKSNAEEFSLEDDHQQELAIVANTKAHNMIGVMDNEVVLAIAHDVLTVDVVKEGLVTVQSLVSGLLVSNSGLGFGLVTSFWLLRQQFSGYWLVQVLVLDCFLVSFLVLVSGLELVWFSSSVQFWTAPAGKKVTCANNASYPIKGVGKILITISDGSDLCLPDVLYVPGIKKNLLSVSSLAKNGLRVIFEDDRCIVRDRENGYSLITTGTLENGLFVLDHYEKQIQACIAETKTQAMQDAELWHARFGHVGYGSLMTLQRHNMVHDLSLLEMPPRHVCEGCVLGKMHRFAFSQDGSVRATRKLQLVHSDVCGPMRMPSVGNSLYFVTFIDDFSRFCSVYPLKAKSDVFAVFQHYVSMVENETGCKVQTLRTDRGGEYMSGAFKDFLGKKSIKHQCTMPYTPQQNGVAERKNRSLMEMARCMLKAKSLPHKLWMEAVACAAHVLNRCPTRALKTITPYESWYDRKPSVSYLRVFGCLAYAHIPQQLRGKLDDKAVKCIFVGYSSGSKGYRLYNPATNKIFESRDVIFAETTAQPMVAFDVPHMQTQDVFEGFLPSFVENQESQQVDNFDQSFDQHVTPHDVEEIVREEQEVLREERTLPKWVQKTL